jgi:hypothetical protein
MKQIFIICSIVGILFFGSTGCEHKITPPKDTGTSAKIGDTSYVEISPPWGNVASPRTIMIGSDQLMYVTDYDNSMIYMMDAGGSILTSRSILHPIAIAQNSKLDLYVAAEAIAPNGIDTIGAIYRIALVRWDTVYQSGISIDPFTGDTTKIFRDTSFYYNHELGAAHMSLVYQEPGEAKRRFNGIGILPDNGYLVSRVGPDNSSSIDPDCRVMQFNSSDVYFSPIGDLYPYSQGGTIDQLTGIMVFPSTRDFVLSQKSNGSGVAYGALWMVYTKTSDFEGWTPKYTTTSGVDFVKSYLFFNATAVAYDKKRREMFIVDSDLDSVFKFNRNGQLMAGSFGNSQTIVMNTATGDTLLRGITHPMGVAYASDCTLYITDTGNKLIRRFRLSTQITSCY